MRYTWNGSDGSYTDPTGWAPAGVPLWDSGATAVIQSGTVTLSDAEPNNVSIFLSSPNEATQPNLVLNNAALGPDVLINLNPPSLGFVFNHVPPMVPDFATITVEGYDTNQGVIFLGATGAAPDVLTVAITPYSQLNQEGMISVNDGSVLRVGGTGQAPATLNNDGTIDIAGGSAIISADVVGSGTIAFIPNEVGSVEFAGGVSATQHVSFLPAIALPPGNAALDVRIDSLSTFHGIIDAFTSPADAVVLADTQATGATFDQVTPDAGTLLLLNGQAVVGALTVTGAHASNAYGVSSNLDGSTTVRPLSPMPGS